MKFVVDCMLGKLAKWLKILGFDALFFSKIEDEELLSIARKEKRILLTRDTGLIQKARDIEAFFLESQEWREQIGQVMEHFHLWGEIDSHSRCIACNRELKSLSRKNARNLVTPFVYKHAASFALCPGCGRVYWRGTHFKDMEHEIEELLKKK